jgi:hypothetical protein
MRVINQNFETITVYDLTTGRLVPATVIRVDATPIDNVKKFAWADEDYEDVLMYVPNPVKTITQQVAELKAQLSATDYKVIKCSECQLLGMEMPYDVAALHAQRQEVRDQINALEQEAKNV